MSSTAVSFERDSTSASVIEVASAEETPSSIYDAKVNTGSIINGGDGNNVHAFGFLSNRDNGIKTSNKIFHDQDTDVGILKNNERREGQANGKHLRLGDEGVDIGMLGNNERRHETHRRLLRNLKAGKYSKKVKGSKTDKKKKDKDTIRPSASPSIAPSLSAAPTTLCSKVLPALAPMQDIVTTCLYGPDSCPYGPIQCWDTSLVENMDYAFQDKSNFNLDISGWNTGSCTSMKKMFSNADGFNGDISGWEVSKVANMESMFYDADNFNQCLSPWKDKLGSTTGSTTNVYYLFYYSFGCTYPRDPQFPFTNPNNKWCSC